MQGGGSITIIPISTTMIQVAVGSASNIWGVDAGQRIWKYTGSGTNWTQIAGSLKQVSVGADGSVWGVNSSNQIYQYQGGNAWSQIAGGLSQVSVGSASSIWGVGTDGAQIWQRTGSTWTQIAGSLKQVSAASDGTVLGVNSSGMIYQYNGNNTWTQMIGNTGDPPGSGSVPFAQVAVGSSTFIRSLDAKANLYTYLAEIPVWTVEGSFGSGARYIALASDQTFVFIDSTGTTQLMPWNPTPPAG
jgi:hypothetical protein